MLLLVELDKRLQSLLEVSFKLTIPHSPTLLVAQDVLRVIMYMFTTMTLWSQMISLSKISLWLQRRLMIQLQRRLIILHQKMKHLLRNQLQSHIPMLIWLMTKVPRDGAARRQVISDSNVVQEILVDRIDNWFQTHGHQHRTSSLQMILLWLLVLKRHQTVVQETTRLQRIVILQSLWQVKVWVNLTLAVGSSRLSVDYQLSRSSQLLTQLPRLTLDWLIASGNQVFSLNMARINGHHTLILRFQKCSSSMMKPLVQFQRWNTSKLSTPWMI